MAKGKDYYGATVTEVIANACREMAVSQEELNIEILETGSSGIFGLCRKRAHIRVTRKEKQSTGSEQHLEKKTEQKDIVKPPVKKKGQKSVVAPAELKEAPDVEGMEGKKKIEPPRKPPKKPVAEKKSGKNETITKAKENARPSAEPSAPPERPSDEALAAIQKDIEEILKIMGFPSTVTVSMEKHTVACRINDEHRDDLVGRDGRTLDSLQYLLRKMTSRSLPERTILSLDVGDYRERRADELKERALELANRVREDGKTQAISALNPSERRVVHMALQEDKTIRSRSVGEGLFKKVLIYKPGKKKPYPRKDKGEGRKSEKDDDSTGDKVISDSNK